MPDTLKARNPQRNRILFITISLVLASVTATYGAGVAALQFNGAGAYVDIGPWPELTSEVMTHPVTFECWLSSANSSTLMTLLGAVNTADSTFFRISLNKDGMRQTQSGGIKLLQRDANGTFFRGGTASGLDTGITNGEWHHLALLFDAVTGDLAIYVDGVGQELSFMDAATPVNMTDFEYPVVPLGSRNLRGTVDQHFEGLLAEIRMWNSMRSAAEILRDMGLSLSGQPEGLIGYWSFNEGEGAIALDGSGNERHGTLAGATWIQDGPPVVPPFKASRPVPADGAVDVLPDVILSWTPGESTVTHDVYLGTVFEDVNAASKEAPLGVLVSPGQEANSLDGGRLDLGTTYYWRVDEVSAAPDYTVYQGKVWSFTTEPVAYPIVPMAVTASSAHQVDMGPERTIDRSGLDAEDRHSATAADMWLSSATDTDRWIQYTFDKPQKLHAMWVWNSNQSIETLIGFGAKDVTIETSLDGSDWNPLTSVPEFAQAPGIPGYGHNTVVDFGGRTAQYVRLTVLSGWGQAVSQYGLSEVRFFGVPVYAGEPQPMDGSAVEGLEVTLQWRPGREAAVHEIVLSRDLGGVQDGSAVIGSTPANRFQLDSLDYGAEYFWRVNEVNEMETPPLYASDIWRFQTPEYLVIDDFEMYADKEFLEIWAFWVDGYQDEANGSIVGVGNVGETTVVYEGNQSMPIQYDNSGAATSEVSRRFDPSLDWQKGRPTTLSLQVRGNPPAFLEAADGTLTIGAFGNDIWNTEDQFRFVHRRLTGNGSITVKIDSVVEANAWTKAGVMIRESLTAESANAFSFVTPNGRVGVQFRGAPFAGTDSTRSAEPNDITLPFWVRLTRQGNALKGERSGDGVTWEPMVRVDQPDAPTEMDIVMVPEVYIGLAVTSHDVATGTVAVFSDVATTGNVSGTWTVDAIGAPHPSNNPAPLYLVVKDTAGQSETVFHPHPHAVLSTTWQPWHIAISDLGSVNLGQVDTITLGIGEPGASASGAQGTVYVDLLQVGTPLSSTE